MVEVEASRPARLSGIGRPPYTITWEGTDERVTLVQVPGPRVDFTPFLQPPPVRGPLVTLDVRPSPPARALVVVAENDTYPATPTDDGFVVQAPRGQPIDIIAVFGDERPVGLGRRHVPRPETSPQPLAIAPEIALSDRTAVRLAAAPAGHIRGELTWRGLRTGLLLGEGLGTRQEAVAIARPLADDLPEAGLWLEAEARNPGERAPYAATAAHLSLATREATLEWPPDGEVSPAPGAAEAAPALDADRRHLRWTPGAAEWVEVAIDAHDGCHPGLRWRVLAPAAPGEVTLPLLPSDPLQRPRLEVTIDLHERPGISWADAVSGAAPPPTRWPRTLAGTRLRRAAGVLRGGGACPADPDQGLYVVEDAECTGESSRRVVVDRCGRVLPEDGDVDFCSATTADLRPTGDALTLGEARLVAPAQPEVVPPGHLQGDYHRLDVWRRRYATDAEGRPADPLEAAVRIEAGGVEAGPYARINPTGRIRLRGRRISLDGALVTYDGVEGTLALDGCGAAQALSRVEDGLEITLWRPDGRGAGEQVYIALRRQ